MEKKQRLHIFIVGLIMVSTIPMQALTLTSTAFKHEGPIPKQYTCDGQNISPVLAWEYVPDGTKSFALIIDDPDAPSKTWVHWIVYNIPADVRRLPQNDSKYLMGLNDFDTTKYDGPCPPSGMHRYRFTLYALDTMIPTAAQAPNKDRLLNAMQGHILEQTVLVGTYTRTS